MPIQRLSFLLLLTLSAGLVACQDRTATQSAQPGATAPEVTPAQAPPAAQVALALEPVSLPSCDSAEVLVKWDARIIPSDASEIEIWVGKSDDNKLWMASSPFGEAKTGPWTNPGAVFILKNKADGLELARTVMQGPDCG